MEGERTQQRRRAGPRMHRSRELGHQAQAHQVEACSGGACVFRECGWGRGVELRGKERGGGREEERDEENEQKENGMKSEQEGGRQGRKRRAAASEVIEKGRREERSRGGTG
eukprot:4440424-Pleurochrysis_carterae.AAC.1